MNTNTNIDNYAFTPRQIDAAYINSLVNLVNMIQYKVSKTDGELLLKDSKGMPFAMITVMAVHVMEVFLTTLSTQMIGHVLVRGKQLISLGIMTMLVYMTPKH